MINQMSKRISSFYIKNNIIGKSEKEIYEYSLELLFSFIVNLFFIMLLSLLVHRFGETALYVVGFFSLRVVAGGYHARNHFRCLLLTICTYLIFLLIISFLQISMYLSFTITNLVLSVILIFTFAPVADTNKPFSEKEFYKYKKSSRLIISIYLSISILFSIVFRNTPIAVSLSIGILFASTSLAIARIIQRKN